MTPLCLYLEVPAHVKRVCSLLSGAGYEAYVVGGCVRDRLLGREPHDWDVTTSATPDQVREAVEREQNTRWYIVPTGEKYGTLTLLYPVNCGVKPDAVEVTTYRLDGDYSDGRRPDKVIFGTSLEEDVKRRDFTVNALAYDPITEDLHDFVGGLEDLKSNTIRAVGDPLERFREDGLRALRAVRFSCQLNFSLSKDTFNVLCNGGGFKFVEHLSAERVRSEFFKILESDLVDIGLNHLAVMGILDVWLPEWKAMSAQMQNRHHKYDVWRHTILTIRNLEELALLRFAGLLHDVGKPATAEPKDECRACGLSESEHTAGPKYCEIHQHYKACEHTGGVMGPTGWEFCKDFAQGYSFIHHEDCGAKMAEEICRRFKLSNDQTQYVTTLIREHLLCYDSSWSDAAVRRFIKRVPMEYLNDLFALCRADRLAHGYYNADKPKVGLIEEFKRRCIEQLSYKPPLKVNDLAVSGADVMEHLGINSGPAVGAELKRLQELVLEDPNLNEKHLLINLMKQDKLHET